MADDYVTLSMDQEKAFRVHFNNFDHRKEGAISTADLGTVLRACGQAPTESWIRDKIKGIDTEHKGIMEWETFLFVLRMCMTHGNPDDELLEAFRRFDKLGTGVITTSKLREVLTTLGDVLSESEIDELITDADPLSRGEVNYESVCRMLVYGPD